MKLFSLQYRPLSIVVGFNLFTLIVFLTAPYQWATDNLPIVTLLILFSQLAIGFGFTLGYRSRKHTLRKTQLFQGISNRGQNLIFVLCFLTFPLKYAYLLGFYPQDIGGMVDFLMAGIRDPHLGYSLAIDPTNAPTIRWSVYFIISMINQIFFIIGFLGWKEYNGWKKGFFLLFLAAEILYFMGTARNFGLIYLITTFLFTQLYRIKAVSFTLLQTLKYSAVLLILLIGSIAIFSYNLHARGNVSELNLEQFALGDVKVDPDSNVFSFLPSTLHRTYMYVVSYLAQGYYHTCLAFDLDFKWTWLVGNNPALISLAESFGVNVWEETYMYRLGSFGVDPLMQWHSAYVWFASDVSFLGVPVLLFLLGYIFGFSWDLGVNHDDLLSKIIFVITANVLLHLFANNTYLSTVFYSLMFILPVWCWTRLVRALGSSS